MAALDELNQLERVFLRLGHAETDDQLQDVISKFLPPVLLKLSSGQEGVRKKVMELLVHLNKRIKSRPRIQLPVETLLVQYQDPAAASFVTNFTIIYIKMGFPRLSESQQSELAPTLITAMESKPQPQQDSLLQLLIPALCHMSSSSEARTLGPRVLAERPVMLQLLLDFMLDVLLMPYGFVLKEGAARPAPASPQGPGTAVPAPALPQPPPGMSVYGVKRVMGEVPWSPEQLEQCKLGIVRFLEAERVCDVDSVLHLVVASSDTRHSVATAADLELKSKQSIIDWNNPLIISKMFKIYLGDITLKAKGSAVKPELKHEPVSTRVKLKILPHFLRSRLAAESFPSNIQVVYDGLFGTNTNAKLKYLTLQFVHHICTMCPESNKPLGLMLLNGLTKLINEHREDVKLLCSAYSAVGKLSSRMPQLFTKDIALVQQFFESMCQAEAEVRLAIQEALCMMVAAYEHLQGALLNLMEALVAAYITKPEVQVRQVAVKFCSTVFAADHVNSRYLLLLAAGDPREEVSGEARRVLRSPTAPQPGREGARVMPPFPEMMEYIQEKASDRLQMSDRHTVGTHTLPFSPATFTQVVLYLRACLACSAGATPTSQSLSDMQDDAPMIGRYVRSLLCSEATPSREAVHAYMELLQQLLSALGGVQVMYCLLEIVSVCPEQLAHTLLHKSDWIKVLMSSSKEDVRELAAQLFAVVFSTLSGKQLQCVIHSLLKSSRDAHSPETQHGSILALGFMMGRYMSARRSVLPDDSTCREEEELIAMTTSSLGELLESECPPLALAAVTALGEMGRSGGLPVPAEGCGFTKLRLVDALLAKISSGKETGKMKERAVQTLGLLPVGDGAFPHQQKILQGLMDSVEAKQVELQFTVGEALTNAAVGTCSRAARDPWTTAEDQYCPPEGNGDQVSWMLNSILSKYIQSANPHVRQASCIWLLTITNTLQRHPDIQSQLKNIQSAFISILSDPDEVSQGVASKALGLVYELCGPQEQQQLVSALVETLMTGKRVKHAVSADTEVFQEETLGRAPDGHGLSTYKELCALASDLNQPDLVYKFMNLANHHAMWNSRKGAAFGFNVIAAKAGEQLEPFLPQLVPRLYRYQFDPNPSVREAMSSIWDALVTEKSAVEKYFRQILNDVITNLTSNIWRVRESSCLALRDLLRTRQEEELLERMQEIWEMLFRVLDDIKESVRKAADSALKTLSNVCVRLCESAGVAAQKTVAVLLPTLLDRGVVSSVAEVRSLSVQTLVKISKTAGARLKPHASRLVPALLEALSVLEPQVLNYLSLRASEHEKGVMDAARLSAVKSSPLMETINMCVLHLDGSVLADLVPKLCDLLKSNVGLGTKGGCCSVIVSLTVQLPQELAPHSGRLMAALMIGVSERSSVLQKSLAATVGHVVRTAKSSSVEKLLQKLNGWYLEKDEAGCRAWCCVVLHAVSEFSPDVLRGHCGVALPLAFLGLHQKAEPEEPEGGEAAKWAEIWNEHTPGSGGGIRLYLPELVSITQKALQSPSWRIKAQGAAAMATIAQQHTGSLVAPHLGLLLSALLQGLTGRTWSGKEELLKAVASLVSKSSEALQEPAAGQPSVAAVLDVLLRECKKDSVCYRCAALQSVAQVLQDTHTDRLQEVTHIALPLLRKNVRSLKRDDEEDEEEEGHTELLMAAIELLGKAWTDDLHTQGMFQQELCSVLCDRLKMSTWKVQLAVLRSMQLFYKRLKLLEAEHRDGAALSQMLSDTCSALTAPLENRSYSSLRSDALTLLELLLRRIDESDQWECLSEPIRQQLQRSLATMETDTRPDLKDRAQTLRRKIQALP